MRRIGWLIALVWLMTAPALALEGDPFGTEQAAKALPESAAELMEGQSPESPGDLAKGVGQILTGALRSHAGSLQKTTGLCGRILAVVLLAAALRSGSDMGSQAMTLAGTLAIGALAVGSLTGLFADSRRAVENMTAFSGFLYMALASATAATGAVGSATALYGGTALFSGLMIKAAQTLLLPGISCVAALSVGAAAAEDQGLRMAADTIKQLLTTLLKLSVLVFTAYLSLTGVIRGSADAAAVKAAKLAISSAVPVVGGMIADASETLLVSASLVRSGLGVFGVLGVFAVAVGPFLETGTRYLLLKLTAAAAGLTGEKELSGLISALAGAMGLLAGLTGACSLMLIIGCVCFMQAAGG